ncbi:AraC family transcriptional regulator [Clostridium sp. SHJSY1]|uniref:helix-turn-helix domain-containing protein n=1 Tax=Clostridium sp. SHJSY1 TaxID=2942483 RepID=UPI002877145B|nr:AraC family transcriptional regulator [Clostridium sp. SHJSY1]MDS0527396.1 AraC family transcriptional regulator [Clostridium sp. SHJSY1]
MKVDINKLAEYYVNAAVTLTDASIYSIGGNSKTLGGSTLPERCGLIFPLRGKARFSFEDAVYELETGKVLHAGPNMKLDKEVLGESNWEYALIHYEILNCDSYPYANSHFIVDVGDSTIMNEMIIQLCDISIMPGNMQALRSRALFLRIIEELVFCAQKKLYSSDEEIVDSAVNYIRNHYMEAISINTIAEVVGVEGRRFSYIFQKNIGMSPINYLTEYRINKAKKLLVVGSNTVTQVAGFVGYTDQFYFSRVFKKHTKMSPIEFQKTFRKNPW